MKPSAPQILILTHFKESMITSCMQQFHVSISVHWILCKVAPPICHMADPRLTECGQCSVPDTD